MNLQKKLFINWFFPKELPPCFNIDIFSNTYDILLSKAKENTKSSKMFNYSIPKNRSSRRKIWIVNPINYIILCNTICESWNDIETLMIDEKWIRSFTSVDLNGDKIKYKHDFSKFLETSMCSWIGKKFLLKLDINRFYSSVYTHTIPWIIHGKNHAKKKRNDKSLLWNKLDYLVRRLQDQQSIWIPTWIDTSFIISEIIVTYIGNRVSSNFDAIEILRYADDFHIYANSHQEIDEVKSYFQVILNDIELWLNDEKTSIISSLEIFQKNWSHTLSTFNFWYNESYTQSQKILKYFSTMYELVQSISDDKIISYWLEVIKNLKVENDAWDTFERLLLKTIIHYPINIKLVSRILLSYNKAGYALNKQLIYEVCNTLILTWISIWKHYEVCRWLWLILKLKIDLDDTLVETILFSDNTLWKIIVMDLIDKSLVNKYKYKSVLNKIESSLNNWDMLDEYRLLRYEAYINSWLDIDANLIDDIEFFSYIKWENIWFYNSDIDLELFDINSLEETFSNDLSENVIVGY